MLALCARVVSERGRIVPLCDLDGAPAGGMDRVVSGLTPAWLQFLSSRAPGCAGAGLSGNVRVTNCERITCENASRQVASAAGGIAPAGPLDASRPGHRGHRDHDRARPSAPAL